MMVQREKAFAAKPEVQSLETRIVEGENQEVIFAGGLMMQHRGVKTHEGALTNQHYKPTPPPPHFFPPVLIQVVCAFSLLECFCENTDEFSYLLPLVSLTTPGCQETVWHRATDPVFN